VRSGRPIYKKFALEQWRGQSFPKIDVNTLGMSKRSEEIKTMGGAEGDRNTEGRS